MMAADPIETALSGSSADQQPQSSVDPIEHALSAPTARTSAQNSSPSPQNIAPTSLLSRLGKSSAGAADLILGAPGQAIQGAEYAVRRAIGESPDQATQGAQHGVGAYFAHPVGDAFGVTNSADYQNEGGHQVMRFVSQNLDKGADWIAQKTGLPKADVQNMMQTLSYATPAILKGASKVGSTTMEGLTQTAADDMEQALSKPSAYDQTRATYSASPENTASIESPARGASVGASGTGILARINAATPELKQDAMEQISDARQQFGNDWQNHIDWNALDRQLNADSLPIPGRLTQGQASQNGALISEEWNKRSTNGLAPTFAAQNENQIANLRAIREQSTPDVYSNTPAEHAETLINAYENLYGTEKGAIDAKWDAIRSTSSDKAIFDASQMMQDAQAALKAKKLTAYDPGGQLKELLEDIQRGGLSADGYVSWRQNLGREAMKGGNEGAAASAIIEATNNSPLLGDAAQYRDMVKDALASGRDLHAKIANDPAYNAVVNGSASTKDFVNKFVVNGKPEKVAQMRDNLIGDDVAQQTMRAGLLDSLRTSAALDDQYQGNFAAKSFNKQLGYITPNARVIFNNGELQPLRALGDYSQHISATGRDSWKNFSNTATELNTPTHAMLGKAGSLAGAAAEAALAHHTGGASIPLINIFRAGAQERAAAKAALEQQEQAAQYLMDTTRPAAGIIKK